ncbi:MAG: ACT domain-containing protein [Clostridiales bacterium]|nr:ACT domain-containing protein [Clostridiales bacterium]
MKAILSVIGKDKVGIIAKVSGYLQGIGANIEDISQTILQDYFAMIMLVDISRAEIKLDRITESLEKMGKEIGVSIRLQHEDVFHAMHKI